MKNLEIQTENLSASASRIKDVDFVKESSNMAQQNIMQQAGTSVLATANQQPEYCTKFIRINIKVLLYNPLTQ